MEIDSSMQKVSLTINPRAFKFRSEPSKVKKDSMQYIVLHHSGGKSATAQQIHEWHLARKTLGVPWLGAGYNFLVRKDGTVWELRGLTYVGAHAPFWNSKSMGICFEGDYSTEKTMPQAQLMAGVKLIIYLMGQFPKIGKNPAKIKKHKDVTATQCPGANFPFANIVSSVTTNIGMISGMPVVYTPGNMGVNLSPFTTHTAVYGETWKSIAAKYKITVSALMSMNPKIRQEIVTLGQPDSMIPPGVTLTIPTSTLKQTIDTMNVYTNYSNSIVESVGYCLDNAVYEEGIFGSDIGGGVSAGYNFSASGSGNQYNVTASKPSMASLSGLQQTAIGYKSGTRGNIPFIESSIGYDKFKIRVQMPDRLVTFMFKIDPTNANEGRSRNISEIKTKGGSIIADNGRNFATKTLSGVMLDYNGESEKIEFIDFYENYIASSKYRAIFLEFQGVFSMVEILNLSISESGNNNIIKSYSMSLLILAENRGTSSSETAAATGATGSVAGSGSGSGSRAGTGVSTTYGSSSDYSITAGNGKVYVISTSMEDRIKKKESILEPTISTSPPSWVYQKRLFKEEQVMVSIPAKKTLAQVIKSKEALLDTKIVTPTSAKLAFKSRQLK